MKPIDSENGIVLAKLCAKLRVARELEDAHLAGAGTGVKLAS